MRMPIAYQTCQHITRRLGTCARQDAVSGTRHRTRVWPLDFALEASDGATHLVVEPVDGGHHPTDLHHLPKQPAHHIGQLDDGDAQADDPRADVAGVDRFDRVVGLHHGRGPQRRLRYEREGLLEATAQQAVECCQQLATQEAQDGGDAVRAPPDNGGAASHPPDDRRHRGDVTRDQPRGSWRGDGQRRV
eukprot:4725905-Prymnesium_polylepis.1